jgi:hypothetical protein
MLLDITVPTGRTLRPKQLKETKMSYRKSQPYGKSKKHFSANAAPHKKNTPKPSRGGIRL